MDDILLLEPWVEPRHGQVYDLDEFIHQMILGHKHPQDGTVVKVQIDGYLSNAIAEFWAYHTMKVIVDSKYKAHLGVRKTLRELRDGGRSVKLLWV